MTPLTSSYPIASILEVSDGYVRMSLALAQVPLMAEHLRFAPNGTYRFDSTSISVYTAERPFLSRTSHLLRLDVLGVQWTRFYQLPHVGQVRKEVVWSRQSLAQELRAAEVALRLSTRILQHEVTIHR